MSLRFRGIEAAGFGGYSMSDQLLQNLKWYTDWNLVCNGGFSIYEYSSASWYDDDESKLHPVADERYGEGRVWEASTREFVWESGISFGSGSADPFRVSGVYVNGDFHSTAAGGIYAHHIDYLNGRVIFDEPKSVDDDDIRVEYTGRQVHVGFADDPEFRVMMLNAVEEFQTDSLPSGTTSREHQIWLPSIFIEVINGTQRGLQLGGGQIKTRYVTFHIFADRPGMRNLLMDWLDYQSRSTFWMADLNAITFPFDEYGDVVSGATNWVDLVSAHPWKLLRTINSIPATINSLNSKLFRARVTWEIEIDVGNI